MSSTYSRNSWPYKNIVISSFFSFQQFSECSQGAEVEEKRKGRCVGEEAWWD